MKPDFLLSSALYQTTNAISYTIQHELAELFPDKSVLYGYGSEFDFDDYVHAGWCEARPRPGVLELLQTNPKMPEEKRDYGVQHGWYGVTWEGHSLEVVLLTWTAGDCINRHFWIVGADKHYVKSLKSRYNTDHQNIRAIFKRARRTTPCILVLEDLDSLIDDKNRSFFLNELDGFAANTGIIVVATTNHPERLDVAIVERPSRFDRKYHFDLPAEPERRTYIAAWNTALDAEMHLSADTLAIIVEQTQGFSFAYLKELFVSSMMRWISAPQRAPMDTVIREQTALLREQMHSMNDTVLLHTAEEDEE